MSDAKSAHTDKRLSLLQTIRGFFSGSPRIAPDGASTRTQTWREPPPVEQDAFLLAHQNSIELRRVTDKVWSGMSAVDFQLMRGDEPVINHPLNKLLTNPNDAMSGHQMRALQTLYLDMDGECTVLLIPDEYGEMMHCPVPMAWVEAERRPDGRTLLNVRMGGMSKSQYQYTVGVDAYVLKKINPLNPYGRGRGLGAALIDEVQTAEYAAKHSKAFFYNSAKPELLIHMEGAGSKQVEDAQGRWDAKYRGPAQAYRAAFVGGPKGIVVQELTERFKDLGMVEFRKFLGDLIRQIFGVPPEIIGQLDSSNKATIIAAIEIFARFCLDPRCKFLVTEYNAKILPMFDAADLEFTYTSPIPADNEMKLEVMKEAPKPAYTLNEWRALTGDAPVSWGDVALVEAEVYDVIEDGQIIEVTPLKDWRPTPPALPVERRFKLIKESAS